MDNKDLNVLLIDDDPDDVIYIKKTLNRGDGSQGSTRITLESADRLEAGLERLSKNGIDVLLLDLTLPDSKGLNTYLNVRAQTLNLPVIILTGVDDEELAIEAVKQGAQDYLIKDQIKWPFLSRTIRYAIERHQIKEALRSTNARLIELVQIDPHTELLNRRGLQEVLSQKFPRTQVEESDLYALLIDLDDFKKINDAFGHAGGDIVLTEITKKLKSSIRATDYAARIGGDEFMILLPETRLAEAVRVAEKIRLAISMAPVILSSGKTIKVTASLGLSPVQQANCSIDGLLMETQQMLAESKQSGKNRVSYDKAGQSHVEIGRNVAGVLEKLRGNDPFKTLRQPIFRLKDMSVVGYEYLSRSRVQGFEMPDDFFRLCMENNILTLIDHKCFRTCLASANAHPNGFRHHLNLFPSTMMDIPIHHILEAFLSGKRNESYCVEISEQQLIGDPSYLTDRVRAIKEAGVLVALEDVGYGRSCLESLILLEPDIVKLDKKCVNGIAKDTARERSLKRILNMAQSLNTEIVAKGIESEEDLKVLTNLEVKFGQGFLLGTLGELN